MSSRKSKRPTKGCTMPARKPRKAAVGNPATLPPPDEKEAAAIAQAAERLAKRTPPVVVSNPDTEQIWPIGPEHSDRDGWKDRLCETFGTGSFDFARCGLIELLTLYKTPVVARAHANAALAVLDGLKPSNEVEAMLVAQMYVTHSLALEFMGRTIRAEQLPQFESAGNMAVKMMRTYTAQVEALAKLRRGGEQTVRVEHVHVYPGGKAVVGTVNNHPPGDRGQIENCEQPHATAHGSDEALRSVTYAPGVSVPLWGENPGGLPLPLANGQGQDPLPDARRS